MKKVNKKSIFNDKRITLVVSFLVAVLSWVIVAGFITPSGGRTIPSVRIDYIKKEQDYQNKNLQIIGEQDVSFAEVMVRGESAVISGLLTTDVTVYADYSGVNGPGTHVVPLRAEKQANGNYSIENWSIKTSENSVKKKALATVKLTFEEVETKTFKIDVRSDGVVADEGFFKDTPLPSSTEVTITGPKSNVSRVDTVVANIEDDVKRNSRSIYSGITLTVLDTAKNPLDVDELSLALSIASVEVDIPILEIRRVDLSVGFIGLPQNFDVEWLESRISISETSMNLVGSTEELDKLSKSFQVAEFDVSELNVGWVSDPVNIVLPENTSLKNYDQLKQVVITFESTDLVTKDFDVEQLKVVNAPKQTTITPVTENVPNVTLIGPADQINKLLPENIVVEIDAFNIPATEGQQSIPSRILIPGANRVFAIESYPIICDVVVE